MPFLLKEMPTEISEYIELPDMAELLIQPFFFDCPIEEVYKYGTDFQRELLSKVPLRGNKKYTTVLSEVRFLAPSYRSCTGFSELNHDDENKEWHIDTEEVGFDGMMGHYAEETDIIHLLTSESSAMTEFLLEPKLLEEIDTDKVDLYGLIDYVCENFNKLGLKPVRMPANRIVTFTNHIHRPTDPKRVEFRYMLRVVETDRERPPSNPFYDPDCPSTIIAPDGRTMDNIKHQKDSLLITLPETISNSLRYRPSMSTKGIKPISLNITHLDYVINEKGDMVVTIKAPIDSLSKEDISNFINFTDRDVKLYEKYDMDNHFKIGLRKLEVEGPYIVGVCNIDSSETIHLKDIEYSVTFNYNREIRFSNTDFLSFKYNK